MIASRIGPFIILIVLLIASSPATHDSPGSVRVMTSAWRSSDFDPNFNVPETPNLKGYQYKYWVVYPNNDCAGANSNVFISGGALHTLQNGSSQGCYTSALAHQGHFPWMRAGHWGAFCEDQINQPDFDCPDGTRGINAVIQSDFPSRVSANLSFTTVTVNNASQNALYIIYVSAYWWFDQQAATGICRPWTSGCNGGASMSLSWMETQIRIGIGAWNANNQTWTTTPIGTQTSWVTTRIDGVRGAFGYSKAPFSISPGQNMTISAFDLKHFFQGALAYWSIPVSTHAVLLGYEVGTEGYNAKVQADFQLARYDVYEPDAALADPNLDHVIDSHDLADATSITGRCPGSDVPADWGIYRWNDDVNKTSAQTGLANAFCIDKYDRATITYWLGTNY